MTPIDRPSLAAHVILAIARAQARGRVVRLDELAKAVDVRHTDARAIVSALHREGHVDALRLRLTMSGLALAATLRNVKLRDFRVAPAEETRARVA